MADRAEIEDWLRAVQEQLVQANLVLACLPANSATFELKNRMARAAQQAARLRQDGELDP